MMTKLEEELYDLMTEEFGIATHEELGLARFLVSGSWTEVINLVSFYKTGYRNFCDFLEEEIFAE